MKGQPKRQISAARQRTTEIVAEFVALMHAHERGDLASASAAQGELARLGVAVGVVPQSAVAATGAAHREGPLDG